MNSDEKFMKFAIEEAKKAPFPFGAILVKNGQIIAKAGSGDIENFDPTAHAEIKAIRTACKDLQNKELRGITLYSTCEPCPMCFTAAWFANIARIVFGVSLEESAKLFGEEIKVDTSFLNQKSGNKIIITEGVLREEILKLYERFRNLTSLQN